MGELNPELNPELETRDEGPIESALGTGWGQTQSFTFDLEVTVVKEFDVIAVEGAAIMVNTRETETVQKIGSEDLTDFAVDSVEEAVGRQAGVVGTQNTDPLAVPADHDYLSRTVTIRISRKEVVSRSQVPAARFSSPPKPRLKR